MLTRSQIVERALSAVGQRTRYKLGRGGYDPRTAHPGSECDCSGFVAWCLGLPRKNAAIEWIETSRIVNDALGAGKLFVGVDAPEPGDFVVYGDKGGKQGHCGIVITAPQECAEDWYSRAAVVHCSSSNYRKYSDAIQLTDAKVFEGRAIFARYHD